MCFGNGYTEPSPGWTGNRTSVNTHLNMCEQLFICCKTCVPIQGLVSKDSLHICIAQFLKSYVDDGEQPILFATRFLESIDEKLTASPKPLLLAWETVTQQQSFIHLPMTKVSKNIQSPGDKWHTNLIWTVRHSNLQPCLIFLGITEISYLNFSPSIDTY